MNKYLSKMTSEILTKDYRDDPLNVKPIHRTNRHSQSAFNPTFAKPKKPKIKKPPRIQSPLGRSKTSKITLGKTIE